VQCELPVNRSGEETIVKLMWLNLMPDTEILDDFWENHEGTWVDINTYLLNPKHALHIYNYFMDELEWEVSRPARTGPPLGCYGRKETSPSVSRSAIFSLTHWLTGAMRTRWFLPAIVHFIRKILWGRRRAGY